jgi:hypothetical protein
MRDMNRSVRALLSLAIILSLLPAEVGGQDFSSVIPVLKQLPAPDWVKEGTRMSYYSATANIPSVNEKFILDEEGDWVGQTTGKRYRREEVFGAAGHGVTQVDVLSVEGGLAALKINSWLYSSYTGPLVPINQGAYIGLAAGGDWYINPAALANLQERRGGGVAILKMPYTVNGVTYNAIRIQQESDKSSFAHIYDLQDGKLLATYNSATSAEGTIFAYATFLGVRQMDLPWLGQNLPQWLQKGTVLQYDGTKSYEAKLARYTFPTAVSLEMRITDIGQRYYSYSQTGSMSASGFPSQYGQESQIGGIGQPGGLVLPPAALATLQKGQVIDTDPVTGITVLVKDIGQEAAGRNIAILMAANQAYSAEATYDLDTGATIALSDSTLGADANEYTDLKLTRRD